MRKDVIIAGYARSPFHFAGKGELIDAAPRATALWLLVIGPTRTD